MATLQDVSVGVALDATDGDFITTVPTHASSVVAGGRHDVSSTTIGEPATAVDIGNGVLFKTNTARNMGHQYNRESSLVLLQPMQEALMAVQVVVDTSSVTSLQLAIGTKSCHAMPVKCWTRCSKFFFNIAAEAITAPMLPLLGTISSRKQHISYGDHRLFDRGKCMVIMAFQSTISEVSHEQVSKPPKPPWLPCHEEAGSWSGKVQVMRGSGCISSHLVFLCNKTKVNTVLGSCYRYEVLLLGPECCIQAALRNHTGSKDQAHSNAELMITNNTSLQKLLIAELIKKSWSNNYKVSSILDQNPWPPPPFSLLAASWLDILPLPWPPDQDAIRVESDGFCEIDATKSWEAMIFHGQKLCKIQNLLLMKGSLCFVCQLVVCFQLTLWYVPHDSRSCQVLDPGKLKKAINMILFQNWSAVRYLKCCRSTLVAVIMEVIASKCVSQHRQQSVTRLFFPGYFINVTTTLLLILHYSVAFDGELVTARPSRYPVLKLSQYLSHEAAFNGPDIHISENIIHMVWQVLHTVSITSEQYSQILVGWWCCHVGPREHFSTSSVISSLVELHFSSSVTGNIVDAGVLKWLIGWESRTNGRDGIAEFFKCKCELAADENSGQKNGLQHLQVLLQMQWTIRTDAFLLAQLIDHYKILYMVVDSKKNILISAYYPGDSISMIGYIEGPAASSKAMTEWVLQGT
ncbi:unnamed protein product [Urochloa humidicola]